MPPSAVPLEDHSSTHSVYDTPRKPKKISNAANAAPAKKTHIEKRLAAWQPTAWKQNPHKRAIHLSSSSSVSPVKEKTEGKKTEKSRLSAQIIRSTGQLRCKPGEVMGNAFFAPCMEKKLIKYRRKSTPRAVQKERIFGPLRSSPANIPPNRSKISSLASTRSRTEELHVAGRGCGSTLGNERHFGGGRGAIRRDRRFGQAGLAWDTGAAARRADDQKQGHTTENRHDHDGVEQHIVGLAVGPAAALGPNTGVFRVPGRVVERGRPVGAGQFGEAGAETRGDALQSVQETADHGGLRGMAEVPVGLVVVLLEKLFRFVHIVHDIVEGQRKKNIE